MSGAQGSPADAVKALLAISQKAKGIGLVPYELQARLALGQLQLAIGANEQARSALQSLIRDAKQLRYMLIARSAESLLSAKRAN